MLLFHNCQSLMKFKRLETAKTIYGMIVAAGFKNWDITVSYIDDSYMTKLNSKYRHKHSSTDILSFPEYKGIIDPTSCPTKFLGNIFISTPFVLDYCKQENINVDNQFRILYAHGIAHLMGYDHETEEDYQKMSIVEKRILSNYKQFTEDYDPLAEGLFESWNWNSDLDL
ncbi:hypothetical protein WA171_002538 [Blastocystis sp. BT1]